MKKQHCHLCSKQVGECTCKYPVLSNKATQINYFETGMNEFKNPKGLDWTEIPEQYKQPISFLRQWLNEDRITETNRMVSDENLWHWLEGVQVEHCSNRDCPECKTALLKTTLKKIEQEVEMTLTYHKKEMDDYLISRSEVLTIIKKHMV